MSNSIGTSNYAYHVTQFIYRKPLTLLETGAIRNELVAYYSQSQVKEWTVPSIHLTWCSGGIRWRNMKPWIGPPNQHHHVTLQIKYHVTPAFSVQVY